MSAERTIREPDLAALLRVHVHTIREWRLARRLVPDLRDGTGARATYLYYHRTVDQFLARCMINPGQLAVTVAVLLRYEEVIGRPCLLTLNEAAERWHVVRQSVSQQIEAGQLTTLALGIRHMADGSMRHDLVRILALSFARATWMIESGIAVKSDAAAKMLGVQARMIGTLVRRHQLEKVEIPRHRHELYVTTVSLRALMATLLDTSTVDEWWDMRIDYEFDELVSIRQALAKAHINHRRLTRVLNKGEIPYIRTPILRKTAPVRIPIHALNAWIAENLPLTADAISNVFGIPLAEAEHWIRYRLICLAHDLEPPDTVHPRRACVQRFIEAHRTGAKFSGTDWIMWVEQDHMIPVLGSSLQCRILGISELDIVKATRARILRGIWLPSGDIAIAQADAHALSRRIRLRNGK